jgi:hypothetical protein
MTDITNSGPQVLPRVRTVSSSTLREAIRWVGWSIPALPLAVQLHEMGHLFWFKVFGFNGVTLHYAAVSHSGHTEFWQLARSGRLAEAALIVPLSEIGIATGTGIAVSYATMLGAAWLTTKRAPHPLVVAVGLAAALRFRIGTGILPRLLTTTDRVPSGTDEGLVSVVSGVPEALLWGIGLSIAAVSWFFIIRGLPKRLRLVRLGLVTIGAALGAIAYVGWLGPLLLPG